MTKLEPKKHTRTKGPSSDLVRKAVEVKVSATGGSFVSPGVAALSPHDVYKLVVEKVEAKKAR